ncbi:MAG: type III pantothenate kinase [Gallionella sp.]|nr:type III pantothenate kinase [Gallionella sp.]
MKLLIDAGNTRIKWALVDEGTWLRSGVLPVEQAGELSHQFAGLQGIRQIWVSNVAGEEIAQHIRNAGAGLSVQPRFIVAQEAQCGVRNGYSSPSRLGSDRWAALIAAWHLVRGTCLVVNSGTATTVDALSATGEFIGGLILPGVELMQRSLRDAAVQLQAAQRQPGQGEYVPFPMSTADALYGGALQASCGAIERQYALLGDGSAPVVLSGGAEAVLRNRLNVPLRIVDNLVLQGLWLIAQETNA